MSGDEMAARQGSTCVLPRRATGRGRTGGTEWAVALSAPHGPASKPMAIAGTMAVRTGNTLRDWAAGDWETALAHEAAPSLEARMGAQRRVMGLSMEMLAQRTGLPLMRLQAYEAGRRRVLAPDLVLLCDTLAVGPAYFLADLGKLEKGQNT